MTPSPPDAGAEHRIVLRDGTRAVVRQIRPDDKQRLQEGLQQLSPQSRFLRFHTPMTRLTQAQLRYLTEVDHVDHEAWVALNPDRPDEPGMGVARYVRLAEEPTVAEAAVTVSDTYQRRGLGTALLRRLSQSALDNGISTLRNYVLASNTAMLEIFDAAGASRVNEGGGVYRIDVPLVDRDNTADLSIPRGVLRETARRPAPALRWSFPFAGLRDRWASLFDD